MAKKVADGYRCGYCNKLYRDPVDADKCKNDHDLIYIALSKSDLNRLINFLHIREEALLTETLVDNLSKYLRGSFTIDTGKKG